MSGWMGWVDWGEGCRPASTEALDDNMKPIGIPGEASWPSGKADEYYFVTVRCSSPSGRTSPPGFAPTLPCHKGPCHKRCRRSSMCLALGAASLIHKAIRSLVAPVRPVPDP